MRGLQMRFALVRLRYARRRYRELARERPPPGRLHVVRREVYTVSRFHWALHRVRSKFAHLLEIFLPQQRRVFMLVRAREHSRRLRRLRRRFSAMLERFAPRERLAWPWCLPDQSLYLRCEFLHLEMQSLPWE